MGGDALNFFTPVITPKNNNLKGSLTSTHLGSKINRKEKAMSQLFVEEQAYDKDMNKNIFDKAIKAINNSPN